MQIEKKLTSENVRRSRVCPKRKKFACLSEIALCVVLSCFSVLDWSESTNRYVMPCNCLILRGGGGGCKYDVCNISDLLNLAFLNHCFSLFMCKFDKERLTINLSRPCCSYGG